MHSTFIQGFRAGLSRLKLYFALSRTPHGLLDMAAPAFAGLAALGSFPSLRVVLVGLLTAFAGYTSVYALNDLVDYRTDRDKLQRGGFRELHNYLDAAMTRHPMAYGLLGMREGIIWASAWGGVALVGAYLLNPICVFIFLGGSALEVMYCMMWRISHYRTVLSGMVKTSGAMAAVFAVNARPSASFLLVLFSWLFFWEIGGQNIPADWTDLEEDRGLQAKTIPVRLGTIYAKRLILSSLALSILMSLLVFQMSPMGLRPFWGGLFTFVGIYLLLLPAFRLYRSEERRYALMLFNKASYYPMALLAILTFKLVLESA